MYGNILPVLYPAFKVLSMLLNTFVGDQGIEGSLVRQEKYNCVGDGPNNSDVGRKCNHL